MGFTQVDETTVRDDEGNTYFSPFLNYNPAAVQAPTPPPTPPSLEDPRLIPQTLPSMENSPAPTQAPAKDYRLDLGPTDTQKKVKDSRAQVEAERAAAMTGDVSSFSKAGGVAKTDEDMARILGRQAENKAETARAESAAAKIKQDEEIKKNRRIAELTLETANEYDKHVADVMKDSKSRWDAWKKRSDEASKNLVDPQNAVTNMSTLSKAGWALAFLGAGMQGGAQVQGVMSALNKIVEDDINAQRANIDNKRQGLDAEKSMLLQQDKLGKESIEDWYAAKQLRLTAIGKQLDAKIAEVGQPAALAAGLLQARDAIEAEVIKGQQTIANHFFEQGKQKAGFAHDIYMERLKSKLRREEDEYKESLKKGKAGDGDTLPTGTGLGLQMVDRQTGQKLSGGTIPIKVKGEKAVEAGAILSTANEEASELRDIQKMLESMSSADLARGGTPEFKSAVKNAIQQRARRDNGARISDRDIPNAARAEFGVIMEDSLALNTADALRMVGPYKEGVQKAITRHQRNLASKTENKLQPYIDSETAQKYEIKYNPQDTNVPEPGGEPDDINTAITKAAGDADVSDLKVPGPRAAVTKDEKHPVEFLENEMYRREKEKGRGKQGGLPRIQPEEAEKVDQASAAFQFAPADDIIRMSKAYLRDKTLSEEAKHEIRIEAQQAILKATAVESKVQEEAADRFREMHKKLDSAEGRSRTYRYPATHVPGTDKPTPEFEKFLHTDLVDEMRRRAGLTPRSR